MGTLFHARRLIQLLTALAILTSAGMLSFSEAADQKAVKRHSERNGEQKVGLGDLYALVVGVSKYKNPNVPQLRYCDKDAQDFAEFLNSQKMLFHNVSVSQLLNENATRSEIEKHLWYGLRKAGKDDTVVLFFSGHGADDPKLPGQFFFLSHEADPDYLQATAINMSGLHFLQKLDSKRVVLIADTCHAGGFSVGGLRSVKRSMNGFMSSFAESEGRVILSSARSDQVSAEKPELGNGVFTHYLLKGLKGEADLNGDGIIALREAYEYVYSKTKDETNGTQYPQWEGRVVGEFAISVTIRHSHLPPGPPPASASQLTTTELEALRTRAREGDPDAQCKLGLMLEFGVNMPPDKIEAIKWYQRAATKGQEDAKKAMARLQPSPPAPWTPHSSGQQQTGLSPARDKPEAPPQAAPSSQARDKELIAVSGEGNVSRLEQLLQEGANVNASNRYGYTALMMAAYFGKLQAITLLISSGADVNGQSDDGETALTRATAGRKVAAMKLLLSKGAQINAKGYSGHSALMKAVEFGFKEMVGLLISEGADVNARDRFGSTVLMRAISRGNAEAVGLLLSAGADVNARDAKGSTALQHAPFHKREELSALLRKYGAKE